jgi:hypothetical protein
MPQTLVSAKDSIERFLREAMECAERRCGFFAMLTALSVMLSVSGAVHGIDTIATLIQWFFSEMNDKTSWLILPTNTSPPEQNGIGKKLADLRNGLVHEFSMPSDVLLANNMQSAMKKKNQYPDKYIIAINEFLDAVKKTVDQVVQSKPEAILDANPRNVVRATAIRLGEGIESPPLSGSSGREIL